MRKCVNTCWSATRPRRAARTRRASTGARAARRGRRGARPRPPRPPAPPSASSPIPCARATTTPPSTWAATAPSPRSPRASWRRAAPLEVRLAMLPTGTANDQGKSFGLDAGERRRRAMCASSPRATSCASTPGTCVARRRTPAPSRAMICSSTRPAGASARACCRCATKIAGSSSGSRWCATCGAISSSTPARCCAPSWQLRRRRQVRRRGRPPTAAKLWRGLTDLIVKGTRIYGGLWVFDPGVALRRRPLRGGALRRQARLGLEGDRASRRQPLSPEALAKIGVSHSQVASGARQSSCASAPHEAGSRLCAQIDGEEFPATARVHIEVMPRALTLIVPERSYFVNGPSRP